MDADSFIPPARKALPMIDTIDCKLLAIAYLFGDIDNLVAGMCDEVRAKLDELKTYIAEVKAEEEEKVRDAFKQPRTCPHCGLTIVGPVFYRHRKRCQQRDMAAVWNEPRRTRRAAAKVQQEREQNQ